MLAVMYLTVCIAAGVWAVAALQSGNVSGGTALMAGAAIAFCLGAIHIREVLRLRRIVRDEMKYDRLRAIRPRI